MGSVEMTEGIWGKVSQLNAGEMPLPRLSCSFMEAGAQQHLSKGLEIASPKFFLQWPMVLNSKEDGS